MAGRVERGAVKVGRTCPPIVSCGDPHVTPSRPSASREKELIRLADRSALPNAPIVGRIYPPIHSCIRAAPMADKSALPSAPVVGRIYPPMHSCIRAAPMADRSALPNSQSAIIKLRHWRGVRRQKRLKGAPLLECCLFIRNRVVNRHSD